MRAIKPFVYENLTAQQRVIAAIEAMARRDEMELQRITRTCPQKIYRMSDAAFTDDLTHLIQASLKLELDMANMAVTALYLMLTEKGEPSIWMSSMADLQAAWEAGLQDRGINPTSFAKAACPRFPLVQGVLDAAPPPDQQQVDELRQKLAQNDGCRWFI